MNLLAIESATNLVGAALVTTAGAAAERSHQGGRQHAELLAPAIAEVCALSGLTIRDVDAIAVDAGPGLFTGLRVGVSTAKALAQGLGLGVLAISSLDVLAAGAHFEVGSDAAHTVVVAIDARRGELFTAAYRFGDAAPTAHATPAGAAISDPLLVRLASPGLATPEELVKSLSALDLGPGEPLVIVGDGAVRYHSMLKAVAPADLSLADRFSSPSPLTSARLALVRIGAGTVPAPVADLVPDYLREADARINWEHRNSPRASPGTGTPGSDAGR